MRRSRTLTCLVVLAALVALTGCGSDEETPATGNDPATASAGESTEAIDETDSSSGGLVDVCTAITEEDVTELLGAPVTVEAVPGGGCNFGQEDPRATSVSFFSSAYDEGNGGFDGAIAGVTGILQDSSGAEAPGLGDRAFIATGKNPGGSVPQGAGLVLLGGTLTQIGIQQSGSLSAAEVKGLVEDALELVVASS